MIGLLGKKVGMTTIFSKEGKKIPVTVVEAGPCKIVQIKTTEADGYDAVQVGFGKIRQRLVTKPMLGHFKKAQCEPYRTLKEFRIDDPESYSVGQTLKADEMFTEGEKVSCSGVSKGRGYQGVMVRHNFRGGPKTHGCADKFRAPGSIGASSYPSRIVKGLRMGGHMGNANVTVHGLSIVKIMGDDNLVLIKGSIAGPKGGLVIIHKVK